MLIDNFYASNLNLCKITELFDFEIEIHEP